ncbi:hypothetical protein [Paenibacillus gallinarum]|uniref:DUF304 domain-containing protein n=1 Tax=Paenibacillus gallinarum TaxID=2762232 RepID=A0ABR8T4P9_9BACL|nr:hypothetical protein [Paenibacillus gallinarum]MBD7970736.1 hypothetical protein [Paenibacillus gallinarum]
MSEQIHVVRRKIDLAVIIFLIPLLSFYIYFLIRNSMSEIPLLLYILSIGCYVYFIGFFGYKLFLILRYSFTYYPLRFVELELLPGSFRLGSCSVKTSEIEAIRIDGYWNSTIGVKLKGRKQIPLHLRLKYQNTLQEDEIMKELRTWSEIHQIPIQYKRIFY